MEIGGYDGASSDLSRSLQAIVDESPVDWRVAVGYVRAVAQTLALAHADGIVHGDVKPANILLDDHGAPWLPNFVLSERANSNESPSPERLAPAFSPPERLAGEPAVVATDIYGLGATLFALLAGKPPFFHESRTTPVSLAAAVLNDPVPVHELPGAVPGSVRNLLMLTMAKDVDKRPSSVEDFVSLLDAALSGDSVRACVSGVRKPELAAPFATPMPAVEGGRSRFPVMWVAVGVAFLLLTSGGAIAVAQGNINSEDVSTSGANALDPIVATTTTMPTSTEGEGAEPEDQSSSTSTTPAPTTTSSATPISTTTTTVDGATSTTTTSTTTTSSTTTSSTTTSSTTTTTALPQRTAAANPSSPVSAAFVPVKGRGGDPQAVLFENETAGDALAYQWDFGDGTVSSEVSPVHVFDEAGRYQVTLVAFGLDGERSEASRQVRIEPNTSDAASTTSTSAPTTTAPTTTTTSTSTSTTTSAAPATTETPSPGPVFASFIAAAGTQGSEQTLSFQNTSRGSAVRYEWDFGDGGTSTEFEPSHTYQTPGNYSVTITAFAADGTSSSVTHPVRVDPAS